MGDAFVDSTSIDLLRKAIRGLALSRLKHHSGLEDIDLLELGTAPLVSAHWMTLILAAGKDLRVTFKTYFMNYYAQKFAHKSYGVDHVVSEQMADFMKEFCNLAIGGIKIFLEKNEVKVGTSLPLITRGFDEVFFPPPVGKMNFADSWRLQSGNAKIDCGVTFEIFQKFKLTKEMSPEDTTTGDAEFL